MKKRIKLELEVDREDDGRFIAEIPTLPGVMAYGDTEKDAVNAVLTLALRVLAEMLEHGELQAAGLKNLPLELPLVRV